MSHCDCEACAEIRRDGREQLLTDALDLLDVLEPPEGAPGHASWVKLMRRAGRAR